MNLNDWLRSNEVELDPAAEHVKAMRHGAIAVGITALAVLLGVLVLAGIMLAAGYHPEPVPTPSWGDIQLPTL